jgi:hypothetical protein
MDVNERVDLNAAEGKGRGAKARRKTAKAEGGKRSLNLRIDDDSYKRLSVHSLMRGTTISALVEGYAQSLREFSMPHRLGAKTEAGE